MTGNTATKIAGLPDPIHSGKVRELYSAYPGGDQLVMFRAGKNRLIMHATDRISAFDVVLPTPIPDKGKILTALSRFWFTHTSDLIPNHFITDNVDDYPVPFRSHPELRGRSMMVRQLDMVMVECVARAYLSGSGVVQYKQNGQVCGIALPSGLEEGSRLSEPIFTPTTKGGATGHDEPLTFAEVEAQLSPERAKELREMTIAILQRGREICEPRGIYVADTKVEFGIDNTGLLTLADEVLTPDSSRFWPASEWKPGRPQPSYDKQPLRDWLESTNWNKTHPGPELPDEVVDATRQRYVTAYEKITGDKWL